LTTLYILSAEKPVQKVIIITNNLHLYRSNIHTVHIAESEARQLNAKIGGFMDFLAISGCETHCENELRRNQLR